MNHTNADLQALIRAVKKGDQISFERLLCQYEPLLTACVSACLVRCPYADRQEVLQEGRRALYRAALSYRMESADPTFGLYAKICINHALISHFVRRRSASPDCVSLDELNEKGQLDSYISAGNCDDVLKKLIDSEAADALYERIKQVLSKYEMYVFERYVDAMPLRQIAKEAGKSVKSVSNALGRATMKLRRKIQ
ncbi:MAG: hypothetical protein WDA00_02530 [Eubacteriales bacterium]